jgi:hypothetical protein
LGNDRTGYAAQRQYCRSVAWLPFALRSAHVRLYGFPPLGWHFDSIGKMSVFTNWGKRDNFNGNSSRKICACKTTQTDGSVGRLERLRETFWVAADRTCGFNTYSCPRRSLNKFAFCLTTLIHNKGEMNPFALPHSHGYTQYRRSLSSIWANSIFSAILGF